MIHTHFDPDPPTLTLHGDLSVVHAEAIHTFVRGHLPTAGDLHVRLEPERVDSNFLQMLIALQREAEQRGLTLHIHDTGPVRELCRRLGAWGLEQSLATEGV